MRGPNCVHCGIVPFKRVGVALALLEQSGCRRSGDSCCWFRGQGRRGFDRRRRSHGEAWWLLHHRLSSGRLLDGGFVYGGLPILDGGLLDGGLLEGSLLDSRIRDSRRQGHWRQSSRRNGL